VTSLSAEAGYPVTVAAALPVMEGHLADVLGHERTTVTEDIEAIRGSGLLATGR
jgi:biotin operon repressor